ncbi:acid protease [Schizophyllum commune Tattone D]|nr:acid protease [Schizophyllum commune Tattone D]
MNGQEMVSAGRQRAQALQAAGHGKGHHSSNVPVLNQAVIYTASVGVGSAGDSYNLIVDTGSSNTWVGAVKAYSPSDTSRDTGDFVIVQYGSGFFVGQEYLDRVTLSNQLVINNQSIGAAFLQQGIDPFDGILGLGPTDLTQGTLVIESEDTIPTVTDNLFGQKTIQKKALGVYFAPVSSDSPGGVLTFGGTDSSLYSPGSLRTFPKTTTAPASKYWGYDQSVSYGGVQILSKTAGIADTGTTLIYLPSDAYAKYRDATGATYDNSTGLLTVTPEKFAQMQSLTFNIAGEDYDLIPDAQLWPRSYNTEIGGSPDGYYLVFADTGSNSSESQGLAFINGYAFLERFYSFYDSGCNGQDPAMGFATTKYTNAVVNSAL